MSQLVQIPWPAGTAWFSQPMTFQGVGYVLEGRYNSRESLWFLNVLDVAYEPIIMGVPIVINRDLLGSYPTLPLPVGQFFVVDTSGNNAQPELTSFATDHVFYFLDALAT